MGFWKSRTKKSQDPTTCCVCGRKGLKIPQTLTENETIDDVGRICPRCRAVYCVFCVQKLPKEGQFHRICQACGKETIIELTGKPDSQYESIAKSLGDD